MSGKYAEFLDRKSQMKSDGGIAPTFMPDELFDFQKALTEWAIRRGRAALFADCLAGEAIINSPDGDVTIEAAFRRGRPLRVFAILSSRPAIAMASAPFINGVNRLYRFSFASGRSTCATMGHRFLAPSGWRRGEDCVVGERLAVSDACRLRSIVESAPSIHAEDDPHWLGIRGGSIANYSLGRRPRDVRPLRREGSAADDAPLRDDARERIRPNSHAGVLVNGSEYNRRYLSGVRRATDHSALQVETMAAAGVYRLLSSDRAYTAANSRTYLRARADTNLVMRGRGSLPSAGRRSAGVQFSACDSSVEWDTLVAVDYIRTDVFYDMQVQGLGNFLADGVWSHNCGLGKTFCQLVWAENMIRQTNGRALILTPLAVGPQTVAEAERFGIEAMRSRDGVLPSSRIVVTNYEKLHLFDPSDFSAVVCDESSILKHFAGATQKAVTRFMLKVPYRLLCTATAAPNDYIELGTSSEALGELGYSDMLSRFFRQSDNKSHRMEQIKQQRKQKEAMVRGGEHYAKLSFRVSQTIGQWRLKGHAATPFWKWVASWARACRQPSDLGFEDAGFILPPMTERDHVVEPKVPQDGMLFTLPAFGLAAEREERRRTLKERCELVAQLVDHDKPAVVWCHLNVEGDALEKMIPGSRQVKGPDSDDEKEEAYLAFASGQTRVMIIKPKIGAYGLNWQHCAHVVTFASHSYEQFYQSVRRCWRFGQQRPVVVDIISTTGEQYVRENMARKAAAASAMFDDLVSHMNQAVGIAVEDRAVNAMEVPSWV